MSKTNRNLDKYFYNKPDTIWNRFYTSDYTDWLFNSWYKICTFFATIERFFFWGWNLRHSYDFDSHAIYPILYLKYSRLRKGINKTTVTPHSHLKRLNEICWIAKRLSEDEYFMDQHQAHCKIWGEPKHKLVEFAGKHGDGYTLTHIWQTDSKLEKKSYFSVMEKAEKLKESEKNRLFYLISKYNNYFWD